MNRKIDVLKRRLKSLYGSSLSFEEIKKNMLFSLVICGKLRLGSALFNISLTSIKSHILFLMG